MDALIFTHRESHERDKGGAGDERAGFVFKQLHPVERLL